MRIRTMLTALALTAAGFIAAAGPATADDFDLGYGSLNIQLCTGDNCGNAPIPD
ncbi:hypothetical protein ACFV1F_43975 [Streptomyces sp. NPDC059590]|uniref:hypothetical protein n=1 Tax=unclassified Streptomyces TaxID=2593676 RepID=UPI00368C8080